MLRRRTLLGVGLSLVASVSTGWADSRRRMRFGAAPAPKFPTVQTRNDSAETANTTSHTVDLPAGITSGDLVLVAFATDGVPLISFPAGWTEVGEEQRGTSHQVAMWYRNADGTEGASITVTTDATERSAHRSWRISGHEPATAPVWNGANSFAVPIDPPNLAPAWGSAKTLWIPICSFSEGSITSYPPNYTDGFQSRGGSASGVNDIQLGVAERELEAASEDPGVFNVDMANNWAAMTVAVRPVP